MMEREQCSVRCHLRGFDTGFFCRNRLYRRSYNEKKNVLMLNGSPNPNVNTSIVLREMENVFRENGVESETVSRQPGYSRLRRLLYDRKMRLYRHRERAFPEIQGGVSIACARCGIQLGKEQFGLPAQEEWMPTHFIRRGNRNGGKVTDFRKAEIWLLGYPGILGSISQAERREVCSQGELSPTCGEDRVFYSLWRGFPEKCVSIFSLLVLLFEKGEPSNHFLSGGKTVT